MPKQNPCNDRNNERCGRKKGEAFPRYPSSRFGRRSFLLFSLCGSLCGSLSGSLCGSLSGSLCGSLSGKIGIVSLSPSLSRQLLQVAPEISRVLIAQRAVLGQRPVDDFIHPRGQTAVDLGGRNGLV